MYKNSSNKFRALVWLIDQAILPAVILVASKILSLIVLNRKFNLSWQLGTNGIVYSLKQDFVFANSYSSLFMYFSIMVGLFLVIIRASKWHSTHITPSLAAKLHEKKLDFLVSDNLSVYSKAAVWLSYSWLSTFLMFIQSYNHLLFSWIAYVALVVSFIVTVFVIVDLEKEFNAKPDKMVLKRSAIYFSDLSKIIQD